MPVTIIPWIVVVLFGGIFVFAAVREILHRRRHGPPENPRDAFEFDADAPSYEEPEPQDTDDETVDDETVDDETAEDETAEDETAEQHTADTGGAADDRTATDDSDTRPRPAGDVTPPNGPDKNEAPR